MEGAVKVQNMASMKMTMKERATSQKTSSENTGFTALLQVKKELAKDSKPEKTNGTESEKPTKKPETKPTESKKEDLKEQPEESLGIQEQEALEKAVLQLAAAQMVVMASEDPMIETKENMGEIGLTEVGELPEDVLSLQEPLLQEQPAAEMLSEQSIQGQRMPEQLGEKQTGQEQQIQLEKVEELTGQDATIQEQPVKAGKEEEHQDLKVVQASVATKEDLPKAEVKTDHQEQGRQEDFSGLERRQLQQESDGQQIADNGAFRVSGQSEPLFQEMDRMEARPLRTTPDTLPQDLGKTLAARLPEAGRTLTVELEPASLGKLTIRMTYEAGRAAVSILATNPRTLEILSEKATEIASILEEKTGQETVILTQRPQEQEEYQENKQGSNAKGDQDRQEQGREEHHEHNDSFAQQLRLGLI